MGFQEFFKKLLGSAKAPEPARSVGLSGHFEDETGYYTVRGQSFDEAYTDWCTTKVFPQERVLALSTEDILRNLDNRSGYVREFCLRALVLHDFSDALKPVLKRLNDYVPINRNLATQLSLAWLEKVSLEQVINALPELAATLHQSRANNQLVHALVDRRLASEEGHIALENGLLHTQAKVRRECWKRCVNQLGWTDSQRVEQAMRSRDPAIARSVESDVYALEDEALTAWHSRLQQVSAMPLRRAILVALHRKDLVDPVRLIDDALWDDSYSIRWLAQHWSKDKPEFLAGRYLQVLTGEETPRRKRYALEGFAILKNVNHLHACRQAMADRHATVRKAAFMACSRLDPSRQMQYIVEALQDAELANVVQALRLLATSGEPLPEAAIQSVATARQDELGFFVRLLALASQMPIWAAMHLVSFTALASVGVKVELQSLVEQFLSRLSFSSVYVAPTPSQWAAISRWQGYTQLSPRSQLRQTIEWHVTA
jgi:hypothetical protein